MLGSLPFLASRLPLPFTLHQKRPKNSMGCGLTVGLLHLTAGVSGAVLDLFFLGSSLTRKQVVATKAATQTLAHFAKLLYFGAALDSGCDLLHPSLVLPIWSLAFAGSWQGKRILAHLSEQGFRQAGTRLVRLAGGIYLVRGLGLLLPAGQ
jgi:uncharacterized membrane protein YfcA